MPVAWLFHGLHTSCHFTVTVVSDFFVQEVDNVVIVYKLGSVIYYTRALAAVTYIQLSLY